MWSELRQSVRSLAVNPGFAAVVVLTLALAIGVNSTIFSVLNGVLLRPLDYEAPDRLVALWESHPSQGQERAQVAGLTYLDWRQRTTMFDSMALWRYRGFTLSDGTQAERVNSVEAAPALFDVLAVAPHVGRLFGPEDEGPGRDRQVVVSHGAWVRRFGQDPGVLGTTVRLDDQSYTIVGVLPPSLEFPPADPTVEFVSPLTLDPATQPSRPHRMYNAIGRMKSGVSIAQAQADMDAVAASVAAEHPDSNEGWGVALVGAHEQVVGDVGQTLWVLFGAVVLVLLIACANIANLLLARSAGASRDFAVRAAFGAGRGALLRRSVVDSGVLAVAGGLAGLVLAYWGSGALRQLVPATIPRADRIGIDPSVLAFAAVITIGAGLVFGFVPAARAMRPTLLSVLQEGSRGAMGSRRARRLSDVMVAAEVALALVLLVGAGLLVRSFVQLTSVDPGFRTSGVTAVHIALPDARYGPPAAKRRFFLDLLEQVKRVPGVESASAVSALPMSPLGQDFDLPFTVDGLEATDPSDQPRAAYRAVMPGYFDTMGIPLLEGRVFTTFDGRPDGQSVAVVNETAVERYFPGISPIDRIIRIPMAGDLRIVGVVADVRHDGLDATTEVEVFVPYFQFPLSEMQVVLEAGLDAGAVASAVRTQVARLDSSLPIGEVSHIADLLSATVAQPRFNMALLVGLALCAVLLAAVGVYGVVTYAVTRRTPEIGIRMALGADATRTFWQVVLGSLRVVAVGVLLGLVGAAILGRSLEGLLFGVPPLDPVTFLVAGAGIVAVAAAAASLPARRASEIDPVRALRAE